MKYSDPLVKNDELVDVWTPWSVSLCDKLIDWWWFLWRRTPFYRRSHSWHQNNNQTNQQHAELRSRIAASHRSGEGCKKNFCCPADSQEHGVLHNPRLNTFETTKTPPNWAIRGLNKRGDQEPDCLFDWAPDLDKLCDRWTSKGQMVEEEKVCCWYVEHSGGWIMAGP